MSITPWSYLNNSRLRRAGYKMRYTPQQMEEIRRCANPDTGWEYFIRHYYKIVNVDHGLIQFKPFDFQIKMAKGFHENRFSICRVGRQMGKSTICTAYLLWIAMFSPHKALAILANKADTAKELLHRIKTAYEHLPIWLQQGVERWDQTKIELENGSSILASATTGPAVRGGSFFLVFLDEFAFVPSNVADEFFRSVYPTISSGDTSKMIIVSTPHGMNHYYEMWRKAVKGKSQFKAIDIHWSEHPKRDAEWARRELSNMTAEQFDQEYNCNFQGSAGALISSVKLQYITDTYVQDPISVLPVGRVKMNDEPDPENLIVDNALRIYERPIEDHRYVIVCDPAEGIGQDYSAFVVFDVTELPYRQVATYHSRNISPLVLPNELVTMAKSYNSAYILIETLQIGFQVAYALWFEHDYPFVFTYFRDKNRNKLKVGYRRGYFGVRTNTQVKSTGCGNLKGLAENDQLIIRDERVIQELSTFTFDGTQYKAEEGNFDDLCMCFVLFSWLVKQDEFQTLTGTLAGKKIEGVIEPAPPLMPVDPLFSDENEYLVWETVKTPMSGNFFDNLTSENDFQNIEVGPLASNRG